MSVVGGLIGHSFALISDALNSLDDPVTSTSLLDAFTFAQRPPNPEHPYSN